jgi:hypothetical protein
MRRHYWLVTPQLDAINDFTRHYARAREMAIMPVIPFDDAVIA